MKKLIFAALILSLGIVGGCSELKTIEQRIQSLQDALNSNNYDAFMQNFDESAQYWDSFTETDFLLLTVNGSVTWDFGTVVVTGSTATCPNATKTSDATGTVPAVSSFEMVESGSDFFISEWKENGLVIMNIREK
jgi:outer membrane lipoprotein-sorting protein